MITKISLHLQLPDCSRASVGRIIHVLTIRKVSNYWVPRLLTAEHKKKRMGLTLNFLLRYKRIGPSLLDRIITGDKTWAHHSTFKIKHYSSEWGELCYAFPTHCTLSWAAPCLLTGNELPTVPFDLQFLQCVKYFKNKTSLHFCFILFTEVGIWW